jgi:ribosomal protein L7Ae-like RNA K-turn-binding protein
MRKAQPQITVRESKQVEYEFPDYLKTSWTSLDAERFKAVTNHLKNAFSGSSMASPADDEPRTHVLGYKEVLHYMERSSMNVLCVIACTDNGGKVDLTSRIVRNCFLKGIPVILGKGTRELGSAFGKNRVCCVALTKVAASKAELLEFVMNMSALASEVRIPLEEAEEIVEKFKSVCDTSVTNTQENQKRKEPEQAKNKPSGPVDKKPKTPPSNKKKGNFFSSFD